MCWAAVVVKMFQLNDFLTDIFDYSHSHTRVVFWQIDEIKDFYVPKPAVRFCVKMKRPLVCAACRGFFEGSDQCQDCNFRCREVSLSWNYWLWALLAQVHGMLRATFRERRGVVTLLGVPPAVGFVMLNYFAWPRAGVNRGGAKYNKDHPSHRQGTSKGKTYHFLQFAYDCMNDVNWAFPLDMYYPKTCVGPVRLVTKGRFSDARIWGTPVQFKYKWAVQRQLGAAVQGVHTFSVTANVGNIHLADGGHLFNTEYEMWVAEQQQEQICAVKAAIQKFPVRPLRATHRLAKVQHPLLEWAGLPTPLPQVQAAGVTTVSDDEYDDDDEDGSDCVEDGSESGDSGRCS